MYMMLIVDDNPTDRRGIPTLLDWGKLGIQIVNTCANGKEALDILLRQRIDIVLTDIVMPIMSGIELVEHIHDAHMKTKVLFMSCYSDFEYAKTAVDFKIYGYILKPVIQTEFEKVINKLLDELAEESKKEFEKEQMRQQIHDMLPAVQEQFVKELLSVRSAGAAEILKRMDFLSFPINPDSSLAVFSLTINEYETEVQELGSEEFYYISHMIRIIMSACTKPGIRIFPVQFSSREYSSLLFLPSETVSYRTSVLVDIAVEMYTAILSKLKLYTTIGISSVSGSIADAQALYRQSVDACSTSFYSSSNPIIPYEMIVSKSFATIDQTVNLEELYREVKEIVIMGGENTAREFIERLFSVDNTSMPDRRASSLAFSIANMLAVVMIEMECSFTAVFGKDFNIWESLNRFRKITDIQNWLLILFKHSREYLTVKNHSKSSKLVETVRSIIKERYCEQITVNDISKSVFLSPRYANSIFLKETGKSIFDYLLEYRLEISKKLLMVKDCRISDVCEKVGYENKSYFTLLFKRNVGVSPTEYKARFSK